MMAKKENVSCCGSQNDPAIHPDHTKQVHRINRVLGQIEGVKRMVMNREYCPKIITQIQATRAALKSLESVLLEKHLASCVRGAFESKNAKEADAKLAELIELFRK